MRFTRVHSSHLSQTRAGGKMAAAVGAWGSLRRGAAGAAARRQAASRYTGGGTCVPVGWCNGYGAISQATSGRTVGHNEAG